MWIQLMLPIALPIAKKTKTHRARKAKPASSPWIQVEIEFKLLELAVYTPNLIKRAWKWIKSKISNLLAR